MLQLKRSPQYEGRVIYYVDNIAERYGVAVADSFIEAVEKQENLIEKHNCIGVKAPYIFAGQHVILRELYFASGPVRYCLVYEILEDCVPLISLWHGVGARCDGDLLRVWKRRDSSA